VAGSSFLALDCDRERGWCSHVGVGTGVKERPAWEKAGRREWVQGKE